MEHKRQKGDTISVKYVKMSYTGITQDTINIIEGTAKQMKRIVLLLVDIGEQNNFVVALYKN